MTSCTGAKVGAEKIENVESEIKELLNTFYKQAGNLGKIPVVIPHEDGFTITLKNMNEDKNILQGMSSVHKEKKVTSKAIKSKPHKGDKKQGGFDVTQSLMLAFGLATLAGTLLWMQFKKVDLPPAFELD